MRKTVVHHVGYYLMQSLVCTRSKFLQALTLRRTGILAALYPFHVILALYKLINALVLENSEIKLSQVVNHAYLSVGKEYLRSLGTSSQR